MHLLGFQCSVVLEILFVCFSLNVYFMFYFLEGYFVLFNTYPNNFVMLPQRMVMPSLRKQTDRYSTLWPRRLGASPSPPNLMVDRGS